jgi:hypothetical protein
MIQQIHHDPAERCFFSLYHFKGLAGTAGNRFYDPVFRPTPSDNTMGWCLAVLFSPPTPRK